MEVIVELKLHLQNCNIRDYLGFSVKTNIDFHEESEMSTT